MFLANLQYFPIFLKKKLIINPIKSCFRGLATPRTLPIHIFITALACRPCRGVLNVFRLYIEATKKFCLCLIPVISWFLLLLKVLCKEIISYFTPIFSTLISYLFYLKMYILHQTVGLHIATCDQNVNRCRHLIVLMKGSEY